MGVNISFFRFFLLCIFFLNFLSAQQIEFKATVFALPHIETAAEHGLVRIQLTAFDVLQKEALPNAAVAWLENNRELNINRADLPAGALKEWERFSYAPFYPLNDPFLHSPAIKGDGLSVQGVFSLALIDEQWQVQDIRIDEFALTESAATAIKDGLGFVFSIECGQIQSATFPEIPAMPETIVEKLSADESLKDLDEHGNGHACVTFSDGTYYCGWFQDWYPHGQGYMRFTSGNEYTGEFRRGWVWGYGVYKYKASGDRYEGYFVEGLKEGRGTYYWANGAVFTGIFVKGVRYGEGKYVNGSFSLEGIWINDVPSGVMTAIERNRWHYKGLWDGMPHGYGKLMAPSAVNPQPDQYDGDWYEGGFDYWNFHGLGEYHWESGSEYFGYWVKNVREGSGTYKRYDGLYYDGQWKNNRFHGKGKLIVPKNFTYEGNFEDGETHGQGKCVWDNGREYEGSWVQGEMQGYGVYTWPKSSAVRRFAGWFYQSKPKGEGEFETVGLIDNSTILYKTDNWDVKANGGFGGGPYQGTVEFRFSDGGCDKYEGEWKDLALNGSGKVEFHNDDKYDGQWKNNSFHGDGVYEWAEQNTPVPVGDDDKRTGTTIYGGEWHEGFTVYHSMTDFLRYFDISSEPHEYLDKVPLSLAEEEMQRRGTAFVNLSTGGSIVAQYPEERNEMTIAMADIALLTQMAKAKIVFYTPLILKCGAVGVGALGVGSGIYVLSKVYSKENKEFRSAAAVKAAKFPDRAGLGVVYERWDPDNRRMNPLKIRGDDGAKLDGPTFEPHNVHEFWDENKYGVGQPVYQYIGRTKSIERYICRRGEHNRLRRKVKKDKSFQNFVFEFPVFPHKPDFLPKLIPYFSGDLSPVEAAEQIRIGIVGGPPGKENLQNGINAIAGFDFEKWKEENPLDYEIIKNTCGWWDY